MWYKKTLDKQTYEKLDNNLKPPYYVEPNQPTPNTWQPNLTKGTLPNIAQQTNDATLVAPTSLGGLS